ncbi:MAG: glycoside hydrolase family 38 C-terminal domain-containing protein [Terracidiphilus sp.]|nr:glycoside hydrolase family 38 C-terminal domain-containing protein [Terracidiphilus sp.]MDR3799627.1 glycoside hydrolase family 38 C-terminal domain-containing protein [Terracidiphilus sp.]
MILSVGALLVASPAAGQRGSEVGRGLALLPAQSRAVVERLMSLSQLPAGTWKMHEGDLPHGEAVTLDESGWQDAATGARYSTNAVWFRKTIQLPATLNGYDLTGARVWFQFTADANGSVPEIIYFNGRRVALGEDLEPEVLFDDARPGDKVVVAVKLLQTIDVKRFKGATLRVDFPENRPNPQSLAEEFLSAAFLLPSLAPGDNTKTGILNNAIAAVDLTALDAHDQAKFDASLKSAQSQLEALRPLLQHATFLLDGNAHIDAAWLWPWTETVDVVHRTFGTALQLMNEYPDYTFTQSAAAYNEWLAQKYPAVNDEIKQRVKEGRWEIVGGMWVEPDLNMPDGESLVRQLLVGKRWYKQAYGVDVKIGWNPDSFGYTWQLPQIYKKSGIDYFVTQKMTWNDTNKLPFKLFWWESPDGSKVLAYFPHDYVNLNLNPVRLSDDLVTARQRSPGLTEMMDLYGVGDHGGGPTRAMLDEGFRWAAPSAAAIAANGGEPVLAKYQFGTAQSFFSAVEKQIAPESKVWNYQSIAKGYEPPAAVAGKVAIPTWDTEMYLEYHRGVYTTQAMHKKNMRDSEEEVLNAEKFSSLAWLFGAKYPADELTEDWKKVLFNQFHDLAAGSGIGVIYKDAQKDYDWVRMSTNEISSGALEKVAERIDTRVKVEKSAPIVVYNPLGWERSGDVTVRLQLADPKQDISISNMCEPESNMNQIDPQIISRDMNTGEVQLEFHAQSVPALGYKLYRVGPAWKPKKGDPTPGCVLGAFSRPSPLIDKLVLQSDPEGLRVEVNKISGCITRISEGKTEFEWLAPNSCGNQFQFFKDTPKDYDAWNIDPGTLDVAPMTIDRADSVEMVGNDAIRIISHWQNSKFVQTIRLEGDQIDIENDIDWHEKHVLLKAAFPVAVTSDFATYEIPYGAIERPTTRNNSWEKAQFEVPAMRWADLSGAGPDGKVHGLSVLNQDKYGYDAVGNVLRLTLLRSPTWPDPDADQGHHHFHYGLYPHAGTWKDALTVRHGWEYDYPLQAVVTTAHAGSLPAEHSFASVSPENVVLTAVKKAEDANGLIFRVYEWAGKETTAEFHVPPGATGATVTNLMEQPEGDPLKVEGDVVKVPVHAYEILTILVSYPNGGPKL